jgi:putative redox protein
MKTLAKLELETVEHGLRFRARTRRGFTATLDSGEGMQAPNPPEMLLAALGTCHGMDVISILRKKRQQVTAYHIDIEGERREEHPRSFVSIEMVHRVSGHQLSAAAIEEAIRLSETKYCSIRFSLDPAIRIASRFEIQPA